jgi:hypothetical protein
MRAKFLSREPEGKRLLGKSKRKWEEDVKIDLKGKFGRMWTGFICLRIVTIGGLL